MAHPRTDSPERVEPNPNFFPYEAIPFEKLDWSTSISKLLQSGTATLHQSASHAAGSMAYGRLDRDEYAKFLMMMWHVYDALETALDQHLSNPVLAPIYKPAVLSRTTRLNADICYYLSTSDFKTHPTYKTFLTSFPPNLDRYTSRIHSLSASETPELLLAHAYVRYMADLSGGQFVRRKVMKAYELPESGEGVTSFDFPELDGVADGERASMGEVKKIKEWFRDGMDHATNSNQQLKQDIVKEANVAYELNTALFAELKEPDPTSQEGMEDEHHSVLVKDSFIPSQQAKRTSENAFALNAVVMLIISVTLAHLLFPSLGLTGKNWGGLRAVVGV